jgi:hypothetical protein
MLNSVTFITKVAIAISVARAICVLATCWASSSGDGVGAASGLQALIAKALTISRLIKINHILFVFISFSSIASVNLQHNWLD